ncbi:23S rRNA (pseudouridine(1915)-N(3))-methyltransferase RlmH [Scatolibacter rhodanostii]|uniref:23S rRNA (pseudouridine(1915)-N(3))-methyltransferase RlmH n=1 Tax=Scatolibacter rhodanostii TaxID=2014781 RepID=UPI000C08B1F6|nr:23S rRNA (pseudouridine(1915)-N(3))-methyltransferase RlmH [Scatolibacter rhodanostii]
MLRVKLICIGKIKENYFRQAMAEYEKRLRPFCAFECIEIAEERLPDNPSETQIISALEKEAVKILAKASGAIFSMCIEGKQLSSLDLSGKMAEVMQYPGEMTFIIGSSFGLSENVKRAGQMMSMSKMTFPHTLARVMLTEQIYRATQILANTKYHK